MSFTVASPSLPFPRKPRAGVAYMVGALCTTLVVVLRLGLLTGQAVPVGYSVALLIFAYLRRPGLLWSATGTFCVAIYFETYFFGTAVPPPNTTPLYNLGFFWLNLVVITGLIHVFILAVDNAELRGELLAQALAELTALWRTAPVGLCVISPDLSDIRLNAFGANLLGTVADENIAAGLFGSKFRAWREGRPVDQMETPLVVAARTNSFVPPSEWELAGPNGNRVLVLLAASPVRLAKPASRLRSRLRRERAGASIDRGAEKPVGAVAAFVDVSAAKRLQRELDLRRREAEEASVRKSRFLSAVSHDIRTPANAISLLAELLGHAASNPSMAGEIPRFAGDLRSSAQKLVELVSDVLDFTKLDNARVELVETVFDLETLLREECVQAQVLATGKPVSVRCEMPEGSIWLRTDRVKLGRIVGNLLSNAVKFTPEGEVLARVRRNPVGDVTVSVSDTGIGIPPEALSRIFDEFYQVRSNSTSRDPARSGSGLGLAICRRLAAAMGCRLDVESEVGKGTTFTLLIPEPVVMLRSGDVAGGAESGRAVV